MVKAAAQTASSAAMRVLETGIHVETSQKSAD